MLIRNDIDEKDIVLFLEYYNQPDSLGIYKKVKDGSYPIYKLNLQEPELWLMLEDFLQQYDINSSCFDLDSRLVRSAIKKSLVEKLKINLLKCFVPAQLMTVEFLTCIARRGVWSDFKNQIKRH